jgi:hypothetical protein
MYDKIKGYITGVLGLVSFALLAGVYIMFGKIGTLKSKLAQQKADETLRDTLVKMQEAKNEADKDTNDYKSVRDAYLNADDSSNK